MLESAQFYNPEAGIIAMIFQPALYLNPWYDVSCMCGWLCYWGTVSGSGSTGRDRWSTDISGSPSPSSNTHASETKVDSYACSST